MVPDSLGCVRIEGVNTCQASSPVPSTQCFVIIGACCFGWHCSFGREMERTEKENDSQLPRESELADAMD